MSESIKPRTVCLRKAEELVSGHRNVDYGEPDENLQRIADFWSVYLGITVIQGDVALMMDLAKTARLMNDITHEDGWVDKAGYAGIGYEVTRNVDKTGECKGDCTSCRQKDV